jgi:hypothetical protein
MKFIVLGVDSQSGQEMKLQLEAPDAREAHRIAHEKGIMVSRVVTVTEGAAAPGTVEAGAERPAAAKPAQQGKQVIPAGPPITHFYTKVAGVTFRNFDGSSRQDVVKKCKVLDSVTLKYEEGGKDIERAVGAGADGEGVGADEERVSDIRVCVETHGRARFASGARGGDRDRPGAAGDNDGGGTKVRGQRADIDWLLTSKTTKSTKEEPTNGRIQTGATLRDGGLWGRAAAMEW